MWKTRFGRGFGPVVRKTTKWMVRNMAFRNWAVCHVHWQGSSEWPTDCKTNRGQAFS
jgi:hypothetical protein